MNRIQEIRINSFVPAGADASQQFAINWEPLPSNAANFQTKKNDRVRR